MAGHEGSRSKQDYHGDENNNIEYEDEGSQENDQMNEDSPNAPTSNVLTESAMDAENVSVTNQETAQPGLNTEVIMEEQNVDPDLEEQLGGVIVGEVEYANGQVELLVMSINASQATPEL